MFGVHYSLFIILLAGVLWGCPCAGASVEELVAEVSVDSYRAFLDNDLYAHGGADRHYGFEHFLAREQILARFQGFGLTAGLEPFWYNSGLDHNVVGILPGAICPGEIYIVGAHYDAMGGSPGAYDNAGGAAAVLEAARVLSQHAFEATIVFVAFDREEQGKIGSAAYVAQHAGDDIRTMVNLDCIAYQPAQPGDWDYARASLYYTVRTGLVDDLAAAMESYAGIRCGIGFGEHSDHAPFSSAGFAAAWLASFTTDNPYIHTASDSVDTPGNINYAYATQLTSGVVAYLAAHARLCPVWRSPDFNGDGKVDVWDLAIFVERWGEDDPAYDIAPPPRGDGKVDTLDLDGLMYYWGRELPCDL